MDSITASAARAAAHCGGIPRRGTLERCGKGALPDFEAACRRAGVRYTTYARPGMVHCYCMLPYFKEARAGFAKIVGILKQ